MRVDKVRNQIAAVRLMLDKAEKHLDDLHVLAYDRPAAVRELVHGGQRDYALDTHGDPRARDLLREGMRIADGTCAELGSWTHRVVTFMAVGEKSSTRTRPTVSPDEVHAAIAAQQRRKARGEYTPHRTFKQPEVGA